MRHLSLDIVFHILTQLLSLKLAMETLVTISFYFSLFVCLIISNCAKLYNDIRDSDNVVIELILGEEKFNFSARELNILNKRPQREFQTNHKIMMIIIGLLFQQSPFQLPQVTHTK